MSKISILVVEDEGIVAKNLSSKLEQLGYEVAGVAAKSEEAIEMALNLRPQLILMDIQLDGREDGIQAAETIQAHYDVPVIYLTAHSDPATLSRAKLTGPFGYILKPFEVRDLATQIELALYKHRADRQVREQREWLRVTINSIGDAVIATDTDGNVTFLNPVAEELTGWRVTEAAGRPVQEVFHIVNETTRLIVEDPVSKVLKSGSIVGLANHTVLLKKEGGEIPIDDSGSPIRDADGNILGVVLVFRDISERKRTEEALKEANERNLTILESITDGFLTIDRQWRYTYFNEIGARMIGMKREDLIGGCVWELFPHAASLKFYSEYHRVMDAGKPAYFEEFYPEPLNQWLECHVYPTREGIAVFYRDISERKRAEQERTSTFELLEIANYAPTMRALAREAIGFFAKLSSCSVVGLRLRQGDNYPYYDQRGMTDEFLCKESSLFKLDRDGNIVTEVDGRPFIACMCGNVLCGRTDPSKPFFTDGGSFWTNSTTQLLANTTPADRQTETRNVCNQVGWESLALVPLRAGDDTFGLIHLADPQSGKFSAETIARFERLARLLVPTLGKLRAEEALRESEERFRVAQELSPDGFLIFRPLRDSTGAVTDFVWIYENDAAARMNDTNPKEVCGKKVSEVLPHHEKSPFHKIYKEVAETGEVRVVEEAFYDQDTFRQRRWFRVAAVPTTGGDVAILVQDVTERKKSEEALNRQSTILAAVNRILEMGLGLQTEEEMCQACLGVVEEITESSISFMGEIGADGLLHDLAISNPGWDAGTMYDQTGHSRPPRNFAMHGIYGRVLLDGKSLIANTPSSHPNRIGLPQGHPPLTAFLGVPLVREGVVVGMIAVGNREGGYRTEVQQALEAIAPAIVQALYRKRAENALRESEQHLRLATEAAKIGTFDWDIQTDLNVWTPELEAMYGLAPGEFGRTQHSWEQLVHPEDRAIAVATVQQSLETGETKECEWRVVWPDGSVRWIAGRFQGLKDSTGKSVRLTGVNIDITERKRAEEALRHLNETLEQQVIERTNIAETRAKQLQTLAIELIETEERERRHFSDLLHDDLQQMLAAAKMQVLVATERFASDPVLSDVAHILEESIAKSRRLSQNLSPAILNQAGLIAALEWLGRQVKEQFGLQVDLDLNTDLLMERTPQKVFLFRAVQELLFNTVKHAGVKNAKVEVSSSEDSIIVTISDQGKGFDPQALEDRSRTFGLGLLTIKERASYIGGALTIESAPGQGSRFTLSVPNAAANGSDKNGDILIFEEPTNPWPQTIASAANGTRVLFADDHQVMRQGLIKLLKGQPNIHVLGEASNGREALEQARKLIPDIIIMDISMPEMDGIEATRRIKAELPQVRIIGLSMHDDPQLTASMRKAGAEATLSKTTSAAELVKAIYGSSNM